MKLLIFNWQDRTHPQAGGAEVHLHEIFGRIARMGHEVTLVCCRYGGAPTSEELDNINIVRVGSRPTFNYRVPIWWLQNRRKYSPDIVVDDINKIPFLTPLYIKRPILGIVHHFFGQSIFSEAGKLAGTYVHFFENKIASVYRNTNICTVSQSSREECLERGLLPEHVSVIYNAITPEAFPMMVSQKAVRPTVVYFGRLKKYKSVDHLIRAFDVVRKELPDAILEILGTGDELQELRNLALQLHLDDAVKFHGYVSDEEKIHYLSRAHVAVNTSVKEGWGITNIEANACGTPVVSANVPGLRDSVSSGHSGILYDFGNIPQLGSALLHILRHDDERRALSEGAVEWAKRFSWETSAKEMLELCRRTIDEYKTR